MRCIAPDGPFVRGAQHALQLVARAARRGKCLRPAPTRVGRCVGPADGGPGLASRLPSTGIGLWSEARALRGAGEQQRIGLGQPDLGADDLPEPGEQPVGLGNRARTVEHARLDSIGLRA